MICLHQLTKAHVLSLFSVKAIFSGGSIQYSCLNPLSSSHGFYLLAVACSVCLGCMLTYICFMFHFWLINDHKFAVFSSFHLLPWLLLRHLKFNGNGNVGDGR